MKRESINHTKMKRLCRRMDIPVWQGVGLLESIWHLTARETPQGDIGKLSNEDIALGIDYRGDEDKLIEVLVVCGWLDADEKSRLVVHGWSEHADMAVHLWLTKRLLLFCDGLPPVVPHDSFNGRTRGRIKEQYLEKYGVVPRETQFTAINWEQKVGNEGQQRDQCIESPSKVPAIPEPEPEPEPVPVPEPVPNAEPENPSPTPPQSKPEKRNPGKVVSMADDASEDFDRMYREHPIPGHKREARGVYQQIMATALNPEVVNGALIRSHAEYVAHWKGTGLNDWKPNFLQFLEDEWYLRKPREPTSVRHSKSPSPLSVLDNLQPRAR